MRRRRYIPTPPTTPRASREPAIERRGNALELESLLPVVNKPRQYLHFWSTPEAFADHVFQIDRHTAWMASAWRTTDKRCEVTGVRSMAEALNMARAGWPEGASQAARVRDSINAAHPFGPRLVRWSVAGAYPDVARALSG